MNIVDQKDLYERLDALHALISARAPLALPDFIETVRTLTLGGLDAAGTAGRWLRDVGPNADVSYSTADLYASMRDDDETLSTWDPRTVCTRPTHDHTSEYDSEGNEVEPHRMRCNGCGAFAHYNMHREAYEHDDASAPVCWLLHEQGGDDRDASSLCCSPDEISAADIERDDLVRWYGFALSTSTNVL